MGAGPLPQPAPRQRQAGDVRDVTAPGRLPGLIAPPACAARRASARPAVARSAGRLRRRPRRGQGRALGPPSHRSGRRPGLVSFGLAGGLDPALVPGTLLLPSLVMLPDWSRPGGRPGLAPAGRRTHAKRAPRRSPAATGRWSASPTRRRCAAPAAPGRSTWRAMPWPPRRSRRACRSW